ncbi:EKC/KEOPS complex subunit LAGE3-like [Cavia porcellus]|uniref:EKC/KEOPS complex subunit LAGE3-like n=1 Tax=Cavia porcellus TaxID=10141 RepID=UPI002FE3E680
MQSSGSAEGGADGHRSDQAGAGVSGDEGAYAATILRIVQIPHGPWPFGDIVLLVSRTGTGLHEFKVRVPFWSSLEAEVSLRYLADFGESPDIHRVLTRDRSVLTVRWVAQDRGHLQIVFTQFLEELALLLRILQRLKPLFPSSSLLAKGG